MRPAPPTGRKKRAPSRAPRWLTAARAGSDLDVGLDVVAGLDGAAEGAVGLLLLVLLLDLGEVHADLVGGDDVAVAGAAGLVAADQAVGHRHLEELHLLLAGLAADQHRLLEVLAGGAG